MTTAEGFFTRRRCQRVCFAVLLALLTLAAHSEPNIPESDATILERIPAAKATRELEGLRRAVQSDPTDLSDALQLAREYLEIGRATSDPRFVSYALATLQPWMRQKDPPVPALVLSATALQNLHQFDEALELLDRALAIEPRDAQAWLTKATLLQVRGEFSEARNACKRLMPSDQRIALACLLSVDSLTGRLRQSYGLLEGGASSAGAGADTNVDAWIVGQLAEMAVRLGDLAAAKRHFQVARRIAPGDVYLKAAYADLLLLENRNAEVVELLSEDVSHDVLLLRLAIAARRGGVEDAARWAEIFDARRRSARANDNPHLREHARFLLDVQDLPQEALAVARKNWEVQREPADIELYFRAARRAGSSGDEQIVSTWVKRNNYQDYALDRQSLLTSDSK